MIFHELHIIQPFVLEPVFLRIVSNNLHEIVSVQEEHAGEGGGDTVAQYDNQPSENSYCHVGCRRAGPARR